MSKENTEKTYSHIDIILMLLRYGKRVFKANKASKDYNFKLRVKRAESVRRKMQDHRKDLQYHMNLLNDI